MESQVCIFVFEGLSFSPLFSHYLTILTFTICKIQLWGVLLTIVFRSEAKARGENPDLKLPSQRRGSSSVADRFKGGSSQDSSDDEEVRTLRNVKSISYVLKWIGI